MSIYPHKGGGGGTEAGYVLSQRQRDEVRVQPRVDPADNRVKAAICGGEKTDFDMKDGGG